MMGPGHFWWGGMWVFPLIVLAAVLIMIYLIFGRGGFRSPCQGSDRYDSGGRRTATPLEVLETRYAKGEITREEFLQVKKDLSRSDN